MQTITLISTVHHQAGESNSIALCKILESLKPEVIFEEIPPSLFPKYYVERSHSTLETIAIDMYVADFKAVHVPVDIDDFPGGDFFSAHQHAMEEVLKFADTDGNNLGTLMRKKKHYSHHFGFSFLNSEDHTYYCDKVNQGIEKVLEKINDEKFSLDSQEWKEFCDRRENAMLENIHHYSRANQYTKAVFLLGASHRKSIKEKLEAYHVNELPKLNWVFYGD
jgi:DNA-binding protein Fis